MKHAQKGFTLIEIMIVVAIIAILAAIAIPNFLTYRAQSQRNACLANQKAIANAAEAYSIKHNGTYPTSGELNKLWDAANGDDFLKSEPKCPCLGSYTLNPPNGNTPLTVTCSSGSARDGFKHTESGN